jgi:hypothetical protein
MQLRHIIAVLAGVLIALVGLVSVADPSITVAFAGRLRTSGALYAIAAVRVLVGAALVWGARGSRMPRTLLVIGALMILGGLVTPVFGIERIQALVAWFASLGPVLTRALASIAVLLGAFLAFAARPIR